MVLVYHNITPPEYFIGVHKDLVKLCFRGRRELTAYIERSVLALGDSEYNRQELEALGFPTTGVLPVVPDFVHLDSRPDRALAGRLRRRVDEHDVRRPGDPEQEVRGRHPRVSRLSDAAQPALAAAAGRIVQRLREVPGRCCTRSIAQLGTPDVHFLGHVSNEELTALYDVADLFLCASEHEGFCVPLIEAFYKRVPVIAYAATAVPATMDGGGVLHESKDPLHVARIMEAVLDDPADRRSRPRVAGRRAGASARAGTSPARCCASSSEVAGHAAAAGARSGVGLLAAVRAVRTPRGAAPVPSRGLPGAAGASSAVRDRR